MARIACVDHSHHAATAPGRFLVELLRSRGHATDVLHDKSRNGGPPVQFSALLDYDVAILFQVHCDIGACYYRNLHPNVIFIPMYDSYQLHNGPALNMGREWEAFHGSKILSFSAALHNIAVSLGIMSHAVRCYPEPEAEAPARPGLHGFCRLGNGESLSWRVLRELIGNTAFDSLHLRMASDPGSPASVPPLPEEMKKHNISISGRSENEEDFSRALSRANVFFAQCAGGDAGWSFLEAMAKGRCVVAPDHPAMNEYILHGVNGLLYSELKPEPLDFSEAASLGETARASALAGLRDWRAKEDELLRYILTPSKVLYSEFYQHPFLSQGARPDGHYIVESVGIRNYLRNFSFRRKNRDFWNPLWEWLRRP